MPKQRWNPCLPGRAGHYRATAGREAKARWSCDGWNESTAVFQEELLLPATLDEKFKKNQCRDAPAGELCSLKARAQKHLQLQLSRGGHRPGPRRCPRRRIWSPVPAAYAPYQRRPRPPGSDRPRRRRRSFSPTASPPIPHVTSGRGPSPVSFAGYRLGHARGNTTSSMWRPQHHFRGGRRPSSPIRRSTSKVISGVPSRRRGLRRSRAWAFGRGDRRGNPTTSCRGCTRLVLGELLRCTGAPTWRV